MRATTFIALIFVATIPGAYAKYWKTLPEGVRLLAYRNVQTSKISSSFNQSKAETPFKYEVEANAAALQGISEEINTYFEFLKQASSEAHDKFSLGTYRLQAEAQVNVNGFGAAYGHTENLTWYFSLPVYSANVNLKYKRVKGNNYQDVANIVNGTNTNNNLNQGLGNLTERLPDINGNVLQSLFVNTFKYKEIGDWQGDGLGDLEVGGIYKLIDTGRMGMATSFGLVAPTGHVEDPDIIQDISFGDGQWDIFGEIGGGISILERLTWNAYSRFTYQLPSEKTKRIPYDPNVQISADKDVFIEKLGNKLELATNLGLQVNDWTLLTVAYIYNYQEASQYQSEHRQANEWLALNTESESHSMRFSSEISSITPYLKKEFLLPASLTFNYQTMLRGQNVPKVDRYEVELRMFF